jgi:hypothetical protein
MRIEDVGLLEWVRTDELARIAGVPRSTARRWRSGKHRVPMAVLRLLEMEVGGHVGPAAGPGWRGWFFDWEGRLCQPGVKRMHIEAGELAAYLLLRLNGVSPAGIAGQRLSLTMSANDSRGYGGAQTPIEAHCSLPSRFYANRINRWA